MFNMSKISQLLGKKKYQYNSKEPINPAERAKQATYDHWGSIIKQKQNWQRVCFALMVCLITTIIGLVTMALKSTTVPYFVEVNRTGEVRNVGLIETQKYVPTDAVKKYFIGNFVKNIRELPLDPVVNAQNKEKAYAFLTKDAANKLDKMMKKENMGSMIGKKTIQVKIISILPVSDHSYQVRWSEEIYDMQNGSKEVVPMTGLFTIAMKTPSDIKIIERNPVGLYFIDLSWSKDNS